MMPQVAMEILGPGGLLYDTPEARGHDGNPEELVQRAYLASRAASIASGTSEIMRGIIAMQFLGLPRGA
jgi:alkylation response protein AidB-like acyl-CoA dehydrogenase